MLFQWFPAAVPEVMWRIIDQLNSIPVPLLAIKLKLIIILIMMLIYKEIKIRTIIITTTIIIIQIIGNIIAKKFAILMNEKRKYRGYSFSN